MIPVLSEAATLAAQAPKLEEHYFGNLFGLGGMILLVAWLPIILKRMPLSLPIVGVAIGAALFSFEPFSTWAPHPDKTPTLVERAAQLIVIVSLMGGGLKIERAVGWKSWNMTWRLLGIAMPITIALVMLLGHQLLGLGLATALLLGGVLAPTDPVLTGDVQIEHDEDAEEAEAKLALTSEAGLNDALAGWISLIGVDRPKLELAIIAFFGIRGLGSVYYLSYGFNHATFDYEYSLWGTLGLIIAASILMHGVFVTPALKLLGRRYRKLGIVSEKAGDEVEA